jgi:molybdopterin converting factor small subunit
VTAVKVLVPSPLLSYTGRREVEAEGATLGELLLDLDQRYPGLRFRVVDEQDRLRGFMRFFVNGEQIFSLSHALAQGDEVQLVQALSGG